MIATRIQLHGSQSTVLAVLSRQTRRKRERWHSTDRNYVAKQAFNLLVLLLVFFMVQTVEAAKPLRLSTLAPPAGPLGGGLSKFESVGSITSFNVSVVDRVGNVVTDAKGKYNASPRPYTGYQRARIFLKAMVFNMTRGRRGNRRSRNSEVTISGVLQEGTFYANAASKVNLVGTSFRLDGVLLGKLIPGERFTITDRDVRLTCQLADGTPLTLDLTSAINDARVSKGVNYCSPHATISVTLVAEEVESSKVFFLLVLLITAMLGAIVASIAIVVRGISRS